MARRVNTRFVAIFGASALGVIALVFVARKVLIKPHAEEFVAAAKDADSHQQWAQAAADWQLAVKVEPQNPEYWTELGNELHKAGHDDPDINRSGADRQAWQRALEIQPDYLPAAKSLYRYWRDLALGGGANVDILQNARDRAGQLVKLAPNDPDTPNVQAFLYTITIEGWLGGLVTDGAVLADTEQKMRALMAKDPSNAELPCDLALMEIQRGQKVVAASSDPAQPEEATELFKKAVGEMEAALKGQDSNPMMHFRTSQVYHKLSDCDHTAPDSAARDLELSAEHMDRAIALMNVSDPMYVDVNLAGAQFALLDGHFAKSQEIMRGLLSAKGSDPQMIVLGAQFLNQMPDLRPRAIEILQSALGSGGNKAEIDAYRASLLATLTQFQISDLTAAGSESVKAQLREQIDHSIQQLSDAQSDPVRLAHLQADMGMAEHNYVGVIQTLTHAIAADQRVNADTELLGTLALAYDAVNERNEAEGYYQTIVLRNPMYLPARIKLVEDLMRDGTVEARQQADEQLNFLQRAAPNDVSVIHLEMLRLDPVNDADQLKLLYAKLPERSAADQRGKAMVAVMMMHDLNDAERLLHDALDAEPGDLDTICHLAEVQHNLGRKADAIATVERALSADPKNGTLLVALKELEDAPEAEIEKLKQQLAAENPDPLGREMQLAQQAIMQDNLADAETHFKAAEAIDPNDKDVWRALFLIYNQTKQYDKLAPYLQKLSAANYDQANGLVFQFDVARSKGDAQQELDIAKKMTSALPEFAEGYYCLGQAYQAQHQWQLAIDNFDTAMQKKGVVNEAASMLKSEIDCYYNLDEPDRAMVAIGEGRRRFPDDADFDLLQIHHEMKHGDPQSAAAELVELLKNRPEVVAFWLNLAEAKMEVSQQLTRQGDSQGAAAATAGARDLLLTGLDRFPDDARVYASLADILRIRGEYDKAESVLKTLAQRPAWKTKADPSLMLAQLYTKTQQMDKAAAAYRTALTLSDNNPVVQVLLADMLSKSGKYDEALSVLASGHVDDPGIRGERTVILIQAGRRAEAEADIKAAIDKNPPNPTQLRLALADLEFTDGKPAQAAEIVNKVLAGDPKNVSALVLQSKLRLERVPRDVEGSFRDLEAARALEPTNVDVLSALADLYLYRFDAVQASRVLEAAVRAQPSNDQLRLRLVDILSNNEPVRLDEALSTVQDGQSQPGGDRDADLINAEALIYRLMGKPDQAVQTITSALQYLPGNLTLIRSYLQFLIDSKRYDVAADQSSHIIAQNKDLWWAWNERGQAKAALGDKTGGLADLQQALTLVEAQHDSASAINVVRTIATINPQSAIELMRERRAKNPQWDTYLVMLYHQQGDDASAIQLMEPLLASMAKLPPAERVSRLQLAGSIYAEASPRPYPEKAYQAYMQLLNINPNNVEALNNLASICADDFAPPKLAEGLARIRQAMDILTSRGATDPMVDDTYGWLLILGGQTSLGMDAVHKAISHQDFPEGYYHLGEGYLRMNRPEDAQRQVNLALQSIANAQQANQPVSAVTRAKIDDLSNRILNSRPSRADGGGP